jgi:protein SCO1/2
VLSAIILTLFYSALKPKKTLPIYNPADVNPELVDSTVQYISKYHTIADFSFTNQNGKIITQKDYEGKIYVADFSSQRVVLFVQNDNQSIRYVQKSSPIIQK